MSSSSNIFTFRLQNGVDTLTIPLHKIAYFCFNDEKNSVYLNVVGGIDDRFYLDRNYYHRLKHDFYKALEENELEYVKCNTMKVVLKHVSSVTVKPPTHYIHAGGNYHITNDTSIYDRVIKHLQTIKE